MVGSQMEGTHSESQDLTIRCPSCRQRFKVTPDLKGRMVECGGCDQRFRVSEDVIIHARRFFPGEKRDSSLDRFGRVPSRAVLPVDFAVQRPIEPENFRGNLTPASPFRVILGLAGVALAIAVAIVLMFGGKAGGVLYGAALDKRLILASFTGLFALITLVMANPSARFRAGFVGVMIAGGLLALPIFFTEGQDGVVVENTEGLPAPARAPEVDPLTVRELSLQALKSEVGYGPVEKAIAAFEDNPNGKTAAGVWLRDLRDFNKFLVIDFLRRKTGASESSWMYSRPPDDYLLVLEGVDPGLDLLTAFCDRLGRVEQVVEELNLLEVRVDNGVFVQGDSAKLEDSEHQDFYQQNRSELDSIDLQRARKAVAARRRRT